MQAIRTLSERRSPSAVETDPFVYGDSLDSLVEYTHKVLNKQTRQNENEERQPPCSNEKCKALLAELEENVQTAAKLGSALLERHVSCMAEAKKDREEFERSIAELERDNAATIESNRNLLNSLEELNKTVSDSDTKVRDLSTNLDETLVVLDRANARASRMEILEAQLGMLESEQEDLRRSLAASRAEELAALARWQRAELVATELSDQCTRIEKEYAEEKSNSQELMEKLEILQQTKGGGFAASATHPSHGRQTDHIAVSNFMKEILADNAHLQAGTGELRRMLIVAQDEIGALRDQVLFNQRYDARELAGSPLSNEVDSFSPKISGELHVHHHHHHVGKDKGSFRKPKRRVRNTPSELASASKKSSYAEPILSSPKRWSRASGSHGRSSSLTLSTPVSPMSTYQESSIFDSRSRVPDESRPTSAGSTGFLEFTDDTEQFDVKQRSQKRRSLNAPPPFSVLNAEDRPSLVTVMDDSHIQEGENRSPVGFVESDEVETIDEEFIPDENASVEQQDSSGPSSPNPDISSAPYLTTTIPGRKLTRSTSHESLLFPETVPIPSTLLSQLSSGKVPISLSSKATTNQAILHTAIATPARYSSSTYNRILLSSAMNANGGRKMPARQRKAGTGTVASWFWTKLGSAPAKKDSAVSSLTRHVPDSRSPNSSATPSSASIRSADSSTNVITTAADDDTLQEMLAEATA